MLSSCLCSPSKQRTIKICSVLPTTNCLLNQLHPGGKWGHLNTLHLLLPCPQLSSSEEVSPGLFSPFNSCVNLLTSFENVCVHCLAKSFYWFSNCLLISCTLINTWTPRNLSMQSKYGLRRQRKSPKLGLLTHALPIASGQMYEPYSSYAHTDVLLTGSTMKSTRHSMLIQHIC